MVEINHFLSIEDLERDSIDNILDIADDMLGDIDAGLKMGDGKILTTLFFEPSTRTRLSFASAMNRLGGDVISFGEVSSTSVVKGEVLSDTIRTVMAYCDIIAIRHPYDGSARAIALYSQVPTINAGDGKHEHPTQTMLDLFTIYREKGGLDGLKVVAVGDLKYGRTVHSLAYALSKYKSQLVAISPEQLRFPESIKTRLPEGSLTEGESLTDEIRDADVIYVTRIQQERFEDESVYEEVRGSYIIDEKVMKSASENALLLHPLPRVDEIAYEVDKDNRALYFKQVFYGVPVRMAIISGLLNLVDVDISPYTRPTTETEGICENINCITRYETYLPGYVDENDNCYYCGRNFKKDVKSEELDL